MGNSNLSGKTGKPAGGTGSSEAIGSIEGSGLRGFGFGRYM
jgi:hypothetical protein